MNRSITAIASIFANKERKKPLNLKFGAQLLATLRCAGCLNIPWSLREIMSEFAYSSIIVELFYCGSNSTNYLMLLYKYDRL